MHSAPWLTLDGYAKQLRESDILLSLMLSPHPSYPPLEMAACGGLAVTTTYANKTRERLAGLSGNIIGAVPTIEGIADGLAEAVHRLSDFEGRKNNARLGNPPTWESSFAGVVPRLAAVLAELHGSPALPPSVKYDADPAKPAVFPGFDRWPVSAYDSHRRRDLVRRRTQYPSEIEPNFLSVVTPVWNTEPKHLKQLAESVLGQDARGGFEWVLLDNGSDRTDTRRLLAKIASHPLVRLTRSEKNLGIIGGTRHCLERVRTRYFVPVDHDDLLTPDAIRIIAHFLREHGYPAIAYSDEDKLDEVGIRDPYFKPDWDPVLFANSCYIAHACAIDRARALELEAYADHGAEGSQDWDAFTRFVAAGHRPLHIPEVLYTWRMHAGSTAGNIHIKPYVFESQRLVLRRLLTALGGGSEFSVEPSPFFNGTPDWRIRFAPSEKLSITTVLLRAVAGSGDPGCPTGVDHRTTRLEQSDKELEALAEIALECTRSSRLVHLLWNGARVDCDDWPWEAAGYFKLFPDAVLIGGRIHDGRRIRTAGCYFGFGRGCDSPDAGRSLGDPGYFAQIWKQHSASAVSIQHAVVRPAFLAEALTQLKGSGVSLPYLGPWLGALAREAGCSVVYSPFFSAATAIDIDGLVGDAERLAFRRAWKHFSPETRYLSPHLGLTAETAYQAVDGWSRLNSVRELFERDTSRRQHEADAIVRKVRYRRRPDGPRFAFLSSVYTKSPAAHFRDMTASVLGQSRGDFEWILVIDGPVDAAVAEIVQSCSRDRRVRLVTLEQNRGIIGALSAGLLATEAEFIAPVDADDLIVPETLQVISATVADSQADLLYSDEETFAEGCGSSVILRSDFDPLLNLENSYIWHQQAFRREMAIDLGVYTDRGAEYCHDWDTVQRFAQAGARIVHVPHILYRWRAHAASQSNSGRQNPGSLASVKHVLERAIAAQPVPERYAVASFPVYRGAEEPHIVRRRMAPALIDALVLTDRPDVRSHLRDSLHREYPFRSVRTLRTDLGPALQEIVGHLAAAKDNGFILVVRDTSEPVGDGWAWEALKLFEFCPSLAIVSGRATDGRETIVDAGRIVDDWGGLDSPYVGLRVTDPGYLALALKAQSLTCPMPDLFFVRAGMLAAAAAAAPSEVDAYSLHLWLAAFARTRNKIVGYTPLIVSRRDPRRVTLDRRSETEMFARFLELNATATAPSTKPADPRLQDASLRTT